MSISCRQDAAKRRCQLTVSRRPARQDREARHIINPRSNPCCAMLWPQLKLRAALARRAKGSLTNSDKSKPEQSKRAGNVRHDARGNAVWHWAADTARHAMATTSQLLRRLDLSGLSLEEDQPPQDPGNPVAAKPSAKPASGTPGKAAAGPGGFQLAATERTRRGGGYNPYDGAAVRPAAGGIRPAAVSPPRASWWRRLFRRR